MTTITLSGTPGSGKSTIAEMLHTQLSIQYIYSGMIFRNLAQQHQMSLEEFGKYCETHEAVDRELDQQQIEILQKGNVLLEGRLAGWLAYREQIPAVKIMITAETDIRVNRIIQREGGDFNQCKQELLKREKSEWKRYNTYYNIDLHDTSIYDLVIDSSEKSPEEILDIILKYLNG